MLNFVDSAPIVPAAQYSTSATVTDSLALRVFEKTYPESSGFDSALFLTAEPKVSYAA